MASTRFEFRADLKAVPDTGGKKMCFRVISATDALVDGNDGKSRITPEAIKSMRTFGPISIAVGSHQDALVDPTTLIGWGTPVMNSADGQFELDCELKPEDMRSRSLYRDIVEHPDSVRSSIGAMIPDGGAKTA